MKTLKKDNLTSIITVIGIGIAVSIFLPSMAFPDDGTTFSGFELVFGTEFASFGNWANGTIHLSLLGILAYLLPIAALFSAMKKGYLMSVLLFATSVILLFLMPEYIKTTVSVFNTTTEIEIDWVRSYGIILAQSLAIIGVIASSVMAVKFPKRK